METESKQPHTSSLRGVLSARDTWQHLSGREIAGASGKAKQEIV